MNTKPVQKEVRYGNFDLLRMISICSIILLHLGSGYTNIEWSGIVEKSDYWTGVFYSTVTRGAVPCFVMLSGAFLIDDKNKNYKEFYHGMLKKIIVPTLLFSLIYVAYSYFQIFICLVMGIGISDEALDLSRPMIRLLEGKPNVIMWYMFMLIGLYVLNPIIIRIKQDISRKAFGWLGMALLIYGFVIKYSCTLSWPLWFVEYIGYFILGYVIKDFFIRVQLSNRGGVNRFSIYLILQGYGVLIIIFLLRYFKGINISTDPLSPLVAFAAINIFCGFSLLNKDMVHREWVNLISRNTIWIYLSHLLLIDPVYQAMGRVLKRFPRANIFIPAYAFVIILFYYIVFKKRNIRR